MGGDSVENTIADDSESADIRGQMLSGTWFGGIPDLTGFFPFTLCIQKNLKHDEIHWVVQNSGTSRDHFLLERKSDQGKKSN